MFVELPVIVVKIKLSIGDNQLLLYKRKNQVCNHSNSAAIVAHSSHGTVVAR